MAICHTCICSTFWVLLGSLRVVKPRDFCKHHLTWFLLKGSVQSHQNMAARQHLGFLFHILPHICVRTGLHQGPESSHLYSEEQDHSGRCWYYLSSRQKSLWFQWVQVQGPLFHRIFSLEWGLSHVLMVPRALFVPTFHPHPVRIDLWHKGSLRSPPLALCVN